MLEAVVGFDCDPLHVNIGSKAVQSFIDSTLDPSYVFSLINNLQCEAHIVQKIHVLGTDVTLVADEGKTSRSSTQHIYIHMCGELCRAESKLGKGYAGRRRGAN